MIAENFDYKQSSLNPSRMNEISWDASPSEESQAAYISAMNTFNTAL